MKEELQPKDFIDRERRKAFVEATDKIGDELQKLLSQFPEFDRIDVLVAQKNFRHATLSNEDVIIDRTRYGNWHPEWEVIPIEHTDALSEEAERCAG